MDYEEYLERFCIEETSWKRMKGTHRLRLSPLTRLKVWFLEKRGYLVKLRVDYHYHSVYPEKGVSRGEGFGFVRIHKYLPKASIPAGIEIEEGVIGG